MLREVGSGLTPEEVDGFILDNCAARDMTFDRFFARAFPHGPLEYADEAQEAVFLNFLEERFEELSEHYDRVGDEKKAPVRSTVMELVEDKQQAPILEASELELQTVVAVATMVVAAVIE